MNRLFSRKLWMTVATIAGVATGVLPASAIYAAGAYVVGQGGVDAAERLAKRSEAPMPDELARAKRIVAANAAEAQGRGVA